MRHLRERRGARRAGGLTAALVALWPIWPAGAVAQDAAVPDAPKGGAGQSALEARIAALNPCEPLGFEVGGMSLGVDRVRDVQIETANVNLDGDGVMMGIEGRLTCKGDGDDDLAFDVSASLKGILSRCDVTNTEVNLSNTAGEMAWALDLAQPIIEGLLINKVRNEARLACEGLAD